MAIVTVGDLLGYSRHQLNSELQDGTDTNSLWKDEELITYINRAQQEFSEATGCLVNYNSFSLVTADGERAYIYDPQIIDIKGGMSVTSGIRLSTKTFDEMNRSWVLGQSDVQNPAGWESEEGTPAFIVTDMDAGKLILWPIPNAVDTINLYVTKVADDVYAETQMLEIPEHHRAGLSLRVMALAYLKHDTLETEDQSRSMVMGQKWKSFLDSARVFYISRLSNGVAK